MMSPKWVINIIYPPPKVQESLHKRKWKDLRARGSGWPQDVLLIQQDSCTYELTAAMPVYIRSAQNQSRKSPHWVGNCQKIPFLAEELLATDGCWGRESQFSSGIWPLRGYPFSSTGPDTSAPTGNTL